MEDYAQVGDIVTSTVKELNHPLLLFGDVPPGYQLFGVVVGEDNSSVKVDWNKVEERLRKAKIVKKGEKGYSPETFKDIECVSRHIVRVVAKFDDCNSLKKTNNFVRAALFH